MDHPVMCQRMLDQGQHPGVVGVRAEMVQAGQRPTLPGSGLEKDVRAFKMQLNALLKKQGLLDSD
jgi:hypothetical protein